MAAPPQHLVGTPHPPGDHRARTGNSAVDLVIAGGTVYDGLGSPGVLADVAVDGDRIVAVGPGLRSPARRVIDANGRAVAPGFIDPHTHSDVVPFMAAAQPFKLYQGVTTEIVGNCGNSAAPLAGALRHPHARRGKPGA
jgi:N-acyl-D-amino-acid deacylase